MLAGHEALAHNHEYELLEHLSMGIAAGGIALAFVLYFFAPAVIRSLAQTFSGLHNALLNKWWVDEIYQALIVRPLGAMAEILFLVVDRAIIDSLMVGGTGVAVDVGQDVLRRVHTGRLNFYALLMFTSSVFFILFWLLL